MADEPFHILIIGDFSGRLSGYRPPLSLKPQVVDRDNFDDVMKAMNISLQAGGEQLSVTELEDFHPDRIYDALERFEDGVAASESTDLLGSILLEQGDEDVAAEDLPVTAKDAADLSRFVERVTAGHVVPIKSKEQLKRESSQRELETERMRAILHDPALQAIESAWRSLFMVVREVETDESLKLYILDCTLPQLLANLEAIRETLKKMDPWAVLGGNFVFGQSNVEVQALSRIAGLAKSLGAPFVAESLPPEAGNQSDAWVEFRKSPDAVWIGLALPRVLLRLPYGKETSPIERFPFEEMPESKHSDYVWGNPAFLCVLFLAKGFESSGWEMTNIPRRIDGLPLHIYYDDGVPEAKPCAEILMTETDAEYLASAGIMPLASLKGQDAVMLLRWQSVSDPSKPLPLR